MKITSLGKAIYASVFFAVGVMAPSFAVAQAASDAASSASPPVAKMPAPPAVELRKSRLSEGSWTYPTVDEVSRAYPSQASRARIEGVAVIGCRVMTDGRLMECRVYSETPAGNGFGDAAVKLFESHCRVDPDSVPGGIALGEFRKFAVRWTLQ